MNCSGCGRCCEIQGEICCRAGKSSSAVCSSPHPCCGSLSFSLFFSYSKANQRIFWHPQPLLQHCRRMLMSRAVCLLAGFVRPELTGMFLEAFQLDGQHSGFKPSTATDPARASLRFLSPCSQWLCSESLANAET